MSELHFENFSFRTVGEELIGTFAKRYEFRLPLDELTSLDSEVQVNGKTISFPNLSEKSADNKMNRIINKGLHSLTHKINGKQVVYIDEESGIPLVGSGEFGVVDRNSSLLEVKTHTGCNLNCTYCSVDEGVNDKTADILIDPYFLASECSRLAARKKHPVEFNLGPHGEPLLYPFMEELITELAAIPNCHCISMNTNGIMLSTETIDMLKRTG
ncbi:MAG: radical SAM protein, partial [Nanoarchaeota archaeon]|nr:radical SAM protein [Nanoarchaeota archaeon]